MVATACNEPGMKQENKDDEIAAITLISKNRSDAFNKGDAAAIAGYFSDSAWLMAPGQPAMQGRAAVQQYYQSIFDEYRTSLESGYHQVEVSGDLAYGRGFAKVILYPRTGGDSLVSTAKYLNILAKQEDGTWITTHDIWNGNEGE